MRKIDGGPMRSCACILPMLLLAACGGGGGGVSSTPTPTSTASTTTTTTTTAPVTTTTTTTITSTATTGSSSSSVLTPSTTNVGNINYDDAEYRRSNAAVAANGLAAYNSGASGSGVKIAILDSGITDPSGQFTGRIDAASRDIVSTRGIADTGGHGTSVAAVAAAGRNGSDILGVAFNATLLIGRTDSVDTCGTTDGCKHSDSNLARGVDFARANGAKVINMSLGGSAANSTLISAVRSATAAGIIVVISAGNDGKADPDAFAQMASDPTMNGLVVIAGSSDANGVASTYSNKAGGFANYYLTTLGEKVRAFDNTGTAYLYTGTSYSAPAIAGAVAVMAQAFPNLTGKQIVDLLYSTATDAGDKGADAIYGRGVLNLGKAFQPQGSLSLPGSQIAVSSSDNGTLGSAMGDAAQTGSGAYAEALFLDSYGRAYTMNLAGTVGRTPEARPLFGAVMGDIRATSLAQGQVALSFNIARARGGDVTTDLARLNLNQNDARVAKMISGRMLAQLGKRTAAVFGFSEGAGRLSAMIEGRADLPFIAARESDATPGFALRGGQAMALRRDLGFAGVTMAAESGRVLTGARSAFASRPDQGLYTSASIRFDRRFGAVALSGGLGLLRENETVLGSRFGGALGGGGATTKLIDMRAQWTLGGGWSLAGAVRQGWTSADTGSVLTRGRMASNAFSFDIGHMSASHRFGLRIAQPMRVETGGLMLSLPSSYDYVSGAVGYASQTLGLAPKGRELDVEAAYGRPLWGGWLDANMFVRRDPGNIANLPVDKGAAIRFAARF